MPIYDPKIEHFSNLITYSNSSWNVLSDCYESDFRYLKSFTPKNGVKVRQYFKNSDFQQYWWECTVGRGIPEGDQATGEALAEDGKSV